MLESDKIIIDRFRLHFAVPFVLFFVLTIGNYSFFRYTLDGTLKNSLVSSLAQIRLVLPLWPILYAFNLNFSLSVSILRYNIDILALLTSWLLSSIVSMNRDSYLLYNTWSALTFVGVLLAASYTALITRSLKAFISLQLNTIWLGNSIVLLLLVISFLTKPPGSGIYTMFFSSNSFWAYPLLILGIIAAIKIKWGDNITICKKLLFMSFLAICFIGIYLSARRGPLLVLSLTILLISLPTKFPHILLIVVFATVYTLISKPENVIHNLPDSFMKYRLKRLTGMIRAQKETSYAARERIWNTYLQEFYDNPILGTGQSGKIVNENTSPKNGYFSPHNTFVGLLSEKGLLGTGLLVLVIARSLLMVRPGLQRIYLLLFIPTIAINWVEYNLLPGQIFFLYSVMIWLLPRGLLLAQKQDKGTL